MAKTGKVRLEHDEIGGVVGDDENRSVIPQRRHFHVFPVVGNPSTRVWISARPIGLLHWYCTPKKKGTVLIVDDEFAFADTLKDLLDDDGYRVTCAASGKEGLERFAEERPHLILTDTMTDSEYFDGYSDEQRAWASEHGQWLMIERERRYAK